MSIIFKRYKSYSRELWLHILSLYTECRRRFTRDSIVKTLFEQLILVLYKTTAQQFPVKIQV